MWVLSRSWGASMWVLSSTQAAPLSSLSLES